jgi:hypothetical protein
MPSLRTSWTRLPYARKFVPDYEEDQMLNPEGEARSEAVNL